MVHRRAATGKSRIVGHLVLPGPILSRTAKVSVSLIDATFSDMASSVVAKTEFLVENNIGNTIEFVLETAARPSKSRWLFDATVTADDKGHLATGDFVLTHSIAFDGPESSADVVLILEQVT